MPGYSSLPKSTDEKATETKAERARQAVTEGAEEVAKHLGKGFRSASRALEAPAASAVEALLGDADLPALDGVDPMTELGTRLDREADLWRNLALRALTRVAWADRIAQMMAVVAIVGDTALASVAGFTALFGGTSAAGRTLLLGVAALILALGAVVVAWIAAAIRRTQRDLARDALSRADVAELRLHRIGIALAWRKVDPALYQEALARLERDASL